MALEIITEDYELFWKRGKDENYKRADYDELIKAYEKQMPKKPTHTYRRLGYIVEGCCPVCGESVSFGSCCSNNDCRQAIDWSEEE